LALQFRREWRTEKLGRAGAQAFEQGRGRIGGVQRDHRERHAETADRFNETARLREIGGNINQHYLGTRLP
jgi:hypothetical protein